MNKTVGSQENRVNTTECLAKCTLANGQWSRKLTNPNKQFFLQLAIDSVEDVNREVDCNISYAKKAMICCNLALRLDGSWRVGHLFPHL